MRRACVLLRPTPSYRPEVFAAGLGRLGYQVDSKHQRQPRPDDLLVIWNRTRSMDSLAERYEQAGARVIVAENGYLGTDEAGGKLFALALSRHNGAGAWNVGPEPRRIFELRPWRERGEHILVLPQRGIGARPIGMPSAWPKQVCKRLAAMTGRPIRVRRHPGAAKSDPWPDLKGAHCAVTWGSGAAIKAIAYGIPVFHELAAWIGASAARFGLDDLEDCFCGDRGPMFHRLSWAQWSSREIATGEAFACLLDAAKSDRLFRAG